MRDLLGELGAVFLPFESRVFGASYPYGNKIEALAALPDEPFLFLDTDTLVTGSFEQGQLRFRPALGFDAAGGDVAGDRALRAGIRGDLGGAVSAVRAGL